MARRANKKKRISPSDRGIQWSEKVRGKAARDRSSLRMRTPEEQEAFDRLGITNAAVFALVMMRNPDLCRRVIEASIGRKIDGIDVVTTEKSILTGIGAKGVRLDAMAYSDDEVFDVEMQVSGAGDIVRRTRYYHSAMDIESLGRGSDYGSLPDSYVIFIGAASLLGGGFEPAPERSFRMIGEVSGLPLDDGAVTVILDATAWEAADGELRGMLELVRKGDEAAALADKAGIAAALQGAVERAKESEGDMVIMTAATQLEIMECAIESGRQEVKRMEEEVARNQEELARSQKELARNQEELTRSQEELTRSQEELTRSQEELTRSQEELAREREDSARKDTELARMDEELELIKALMKDKRFEEAEKVAEDPELRARLAREYGIRLD